MNKKLVLVVLLFGAASECGAITNPLKNLFQKKKPAVVPEPTLSKEKTIDRDQWNFPEGSDSQSHDPSDVKIQDAYRNSQEAKRELDAALESHTKATGAGLLQAGEGQSTNALVQATFDTLNAALDAHEAYLKARGTSGGSQIDLNDAQNALATTKLDFADALREIEGLKKKIIELKGQGQDAQVNEYEVKLRALSKQLPEIKETMFEHKTNAVRAQEAQARAGQAAGKVGAPKPAKKPHTFEQRVKSVTRRR